MQIVRAEELGETFFCPAHTTVDSRVGRILAEVKKGGDRAVRACSKRFDNVSVHTLRIKPTAMAKAKRYFSKDVQAALALAIENIRSFAKAQMAQFRDLEHAVRPGVFCCQRIIPIRRIGVYVPAGRFPLFSSLLMAAIPAQVAGVREIAVFSPPACQGSVHPAILAAANALGLSEVYRIGGVQALAAMAYGTETVSRVDKIVGPGNVFVSAAKKMLAGEIGIDFVAGPSEIIIVADGSANPALVAADLLGQAEHDELAKAVLITISPALVRNVQRDLQQQLRKLPLRASIARTLRRNGRIILVKSLSEAVRLCNRLAPEHIEWQARDRSPLPDLQNFGSMFVGEFAAEVLGDYSCGLNHILPTGAAARFTSGLSVRDFLKMPTLLLGAGNEFAPLLKAACLLATAEGLAAHAQAAALRLQSLAGR